MITTRTIADNFSACAAHYHAHAAVQRRAAEALLTRTRAAAPAPAQIVELGCGAGLYTRLLADAYPATPLLAVDLASGMLAEARRCITDPHVSFLHADIDHLPFVSSPHLVTSNATLHWLPDLPATLARLSATLAPGGVFTATIFGPATYGELDRALQTVFDGAARTAASRFRDRAAVEQALGQTFRTWTLEEAHERDIFPSVRALLRHIRATGTRGDGTPGAWTPGKLDRVEEAYRAQCDGALPVTSQIFYVVGHR